MQTKHGFHRLEQRKVTLSLRAVPIYLLKSEMVKALVEVGLLVGCQLYVL